jgi:hypothetical protein
MESSVEIFAIILLVVIGLSHLLQPVAWVDFFIRLRELGTTGAFADGFLHLGPAGFIIAFHNVWSGIPVLLTLLGWSFLIKCLIRFCIPKLGLKMMGHVSVERAWEVQAAGAALLVLASVIGYGVYAG